MPRKFSPSLILRITYQEDSLLKLFRKAVSILCWQATPKEIQEFVDNAPLTGWLQFVEYCKEWMTVQ
jgi:hypothetical protein